MLSFQNLVKISLVTSTGLLAAACGHLPSDGEGVQISEVPELTKELADAIDTSLEAGDLESALMLRDQAKEIAREHFGEDALRLADYLGKLGVSFYNAPIATAEALAAAAALIEQELELRRQTLGGEHLAVAESLDSLAQIHLDLGLWRRAAREAEAALSVRQALLENDDPLVLDALFGLGTVYFKIGRYTEAEPLIDQALVLMRNAEDRDPWLLADGLNVRGELYRVGNRFREAESTFQEGLAIVGEVAENELDPVIGDLTNSLIGLYKDEGRYAEAEALYRGVFEILDNDEELFAIALADLTLNRAELLRLQGRPAEAGVLYIDALERARNTLGKSDPALVPFLGQLAVLETAAGRFDAAESHYREALEVLARARADENPWTAQTLNDFGRLQRSRARFAEAEELYRKALELRAAILGQSHPDVAWTLTELARNLFMTGDGRADEALVLVERALGIFAATPAHPEMEVEAMALKADLLARRGERSAAVALLARALEEVEHIRPRVGDEMGRAEFLRRFVGYFDQMITWQVEAGNLAAGFSYAERVRARVLLDQLAAARVDLRRSIPPHVLEPLERREAAAKLRLAETRKRLENFTLEGKIDPTVVTRLEDEQWAAVRELRELGNDIRNRSTLWSHVVTAGGRPVSAAVAQRELVTEGGVMLLYQLGREASFLFIVPPAPALIEVRRLEVATEVAATLNLPAGPLRSDALEGAMGTASSVHESPHSRGRLKKARVPGAASEIDMRLHALWRTLVPADLWPRLQEASEVLLIPDGAIHGLPFEALVTEPPNPRGGLRYWLDDGPPIRYAASATALHNLSHRPPAGEDGASVLVVADPVFDRDEATRARGKAATIRGPRERLAQAGLRRLPGTAREAGAVRDSLSAEDSERALFLAGIDADETHVRAALEKKPRWLHFATHGLVDQSQSELLAALALTPSSIDESPSDDGLLQLFEIYELELDAELAVLSACESNTGRRVEGEGVFALSRGFLAAGARRVVASQWSVDDASTAALMGEFYRHIAADRAAGRQVDYGGALRGARRAVRQREEWSAPYFWAPFILTGAR